MTSLKIDFLSLVTLYRGAQVHNHYDYESQEFNPRALAVVNTQAQLSKQDC